MKIILRTLIVLFILLLGLIAFLLTPLGLRTTVFVASHYLPGKLHYKKIQGVIIGPITVSDVNYIEKKRTITIKRLHIDWHLSALLQKKLIITKLQADQLHIQSTQKPEEITAKSIEEDINTILNFKPPVLPIDIIIHHAQFNDVKMTGVDQKTFHVQSTEFIYQSSDHQWSAQTTMHINKTGEIQTVQFHASGVDQKIKLDGLILGKHTHWRLVGDGTLNALTLKTTQSQFLNGQLDVNMTLSLQHPFTANGVIQANNLNFSFVDARFLKSLSGKIDISQSKDSLEAKADIQIPSGLAQVTIAHKKIWHANWNLQLNDLSQIDTSISGKILSKGEINEEQDHFHTKGFLKIADAQTPNLTMRSGDLTWGFHFKNKSELHADFQAKKIRISGIRLREIKAKLSGDVANHVLTAHIFYPRGKIEFVLQGQWQKSQWRGVIKKIDIVRMRQLLWHLKNEATIVSSEHTFSLSPLCLTGRNAGQLCLLGGWSEKQSPRFELKGGIPLNFFSNFITKSTATISSGNITIDLTLSDNKNAPEISGSAILTNGNVLLNAPNITLSNISLNVLGKNGSLIVTLKAYSKDKPILLTSTTDLTKPNYPTNIKITSDNALVFNSEEYVVYVTSNVNALITDNTITLSGTIHVPSANIQPYDFHTTITLPASDIVYVGENAQSPTWIINSNVEITLGDDINIKAAGITAKLGGNVLITGAVNQGLFATGEVVVVKGHYSVFGQTLTIEPGSYLNYTHNLLNNPILNISASKIIPTVSAIGAGSLLGQNQLRVGVDLHGSIKSPKITFFSNPATLSQADILSYLLLGYGTNTNSSGKVDYLAQALSAIDASSKGLIGKANPITQIQQGLGLSEMGVESETVVDTQGNPLNRQSSFVIGKHLSKDFYVRYSIGLIDPVNVFQLRYLFSHHWAAQTDYSVNGYGLDVLYTIERN